MIYYSDSGFLTNVEVSRAEVGQELVWTTKNKSASVKVWDGEDGKLRGTLNCDVIMNTL